MAIITTYPNTKILVFAKAPEPGHVKTRLTPYYSAEQAAAIHANLVHHTLSTLTQSNLCPIELWCAPNCDHSFFRHCHDTYNIPLKQQQGDDLGARLLHAFQVSLQSARHVIIIGSDCPTLGKQDFEAAINALSCPIDIALAPATDGGYVLIGLNRIENQLFTSIDWGSDQVLAQTFERINQLKYRYEILTTHNDIDYAQDLHILPANLLKNLI